MSGRSRPLAIGTFVLGAAGLLIAGILLFSGRDLFQTRVPAVVYFQENLAGLDPGAPVTFQGVQVGEVKRVSIVFDNRRTEAKVPVEISLTPDRVTIAGGGTMRMNRRELERLVRAGLRAQLADQSFVTGQKRVELLFRPGSGYVLHDPSRRRFEIPAVKSDFADLQQQLSELRVKDLVAETEATLTAVRTLAETLNAAAPPLLNSATVAAQQTRRTVATAETAVTTLEAEAGDALRSLRALSDDGRSQLGARGAELSDVLTATRSATRRLDRVAGDLETLASPGAPVRDDIEAATRDLAATAASLRAVSQEVERDPRTLLIGRRP